MDKSDFIKTLKGFKKDIADIEKVCQKTAGHQVKAKATLDGLEFLATKWFENIEPLLRSIFRLDEEVLNSYREPFGKILELAGGKPSKGVVLKILESILNSYHVKILLDFGHS